MFNPPAGASPTPIKIMESGVTELLNRYNKGGYKYDAVMALYAHDFAEPSNVQNLERAVKMWNGATREGPYRSSKIATPAEFLHYIENKYGRSFPRIVANGQVYERVKDSIPRISALARYGHDIYRRRKAYGARITLTKNIPSPAGRFVSDLSLTFHV